MPTLTVRQVRLRYLVLLGLRWLPTGLLIPIFALLLLERGLTLPQVGLVTAAQGLVVLVLELPTGGLADAIGRKPVLILASLLSLASLTLLTFADSVTLLLLVFVLQGFFRALDSGPLESWYVDAMLAADSDADLERGLGGGGAVVGVAIGAGALLSGGLVALGPIGSISAMTVPVLVALVLQVLALVALVLLLPEVRPARGVTALRDSLRGVPVAIGGAFGLLRRSRILLALVAVELFWGFGMTTFETLLPVRLSEVIGDPDRAAALLGPAGSVAWLASAGGAALAPVVARRLGVAPTAALLRILQGATVVGMGLLAGPIGVIAAYLACYLVHGASNPLHMGLLHRQVDGPYRTSVLSLNSMVAQPAGALGGVVLTGVAGATSVSTAMLVGAVVLAIAAPLYLPAWRAGRRPVAVSDAGAAGQALVPAPRSAEGANATEVRGIEPANPSRS
ncbi:putative MFS family arabinose efflux permease [Micromonospora pisi]|uniref:Putative MFS family arabinose efflux permease n=1 Tax=Micromonospora pisi TaxID=589240 RepID=A0A495JSS3_9ACTN|nr:MFS transporter [Micromonospora pisi]RKR91655.1 putative MFS family arabinose efflux permease [Micromonospora pisi]